MSTEEAKHLLESGEELFISRDNPWKSRKLWITFIFFIVATVLALLIEGTTLAEWGAVTGGVIGAYFAGNVGEHWTKKPTQL